MGPLNVEYWQLIFIVSQNRFNAMKTNVFQCNVLKLSSRVLGVTLSEYPLRQSFRSQVLFNKTLRPIKGPVAEKLLKLTILLVFRVR